MWGAEFNVVIKGRLATVSMHLYVVHHAEVIGDCLLAYLARPVILRGMIGYMALVHM